MKRILESLYENRHRILLVIACSKRKRKDVELMNIAAVRAGKSLDSLSSNIKRALSEYRECVMKVAREALDRKSKPYPAYMRYDGYFYRATRIDTWLKAEEKGYKVVILSALYGFLHPTEPIRYYDLSMHQVPQSCKAILPRILDLLKDVLDFEKAVFLTSRTYFEPFTSLNYTYRLAIKCGTRSCITPSITP